MRKLLLVLMLAVISVAKMHAAGGITNYPIPQNPDTLKILGVGNSFTDDGMMYLPNLLAGAGIKNVVLGRLYIGGCSLERHVKEYETEGNNYIYYKSTQNKWETVKDKASMLDGVLDEDWDIIVVQQVSGLSGMYDSYQPWLDRLMEILRYHCRNAGACIAWQQTWAYASTSTHPDFVKYANNQLAMYMNIMSCSKQVVETTPIDIVIPTGTAIQNLRSIRPTEKDYTRDGYHLGYKMGRYTAACTWFHSLIGPAFKTTIEGNISRLAGSVMHMTDEEAEVCHDAARKACARHYETWK